MRNRVPGDFQDGSLNTRFDELHNPNHLNGPS